MIARSFSSLLAGCRPQAEAPVDFFFTGRELTFLCVQPCSSLAFRVCGGVRCSAVAALCCFGVLLFLVWDLVDSVCFVGCQDDMDYWPAGLAFAIKPVLMRIEMR